MVFVIQIFNFNFPFHTRVCANANKFLREHVTCHGFVRLQIRGVLLIRGYFGEAFLHSHLIRLHTSIYFFHFGFDFFVLHHEKYIFSSASSEATEIAPSPAIRSINHNALHIIIIKSNRNDHHKNANKRHGRNGSVTSL